MAYNNYYPATYPMGMWNNNPYFQSQNQQSNQNQQQQIQQTGFILVRSEDEARKYPVAPGNSITFKDESSPYCYVKTMGFNQLDSPIFERYRLVKEEAPQDTNTGVKIGDKEKEDKYIDYVTKSEFDTLKSDVEALKRELAKKTTKKSKIDEVTKDDE